jgi:hypothetical protein
MTLLRPPPTGTVHLLQFAIQFAVISLRYFKLVLILQL